MDRRTLLRGALMLPVVGMVQTLSAHEIKSGKPGTFSACCDCGMMDNPTNKPVLDATPLENDTAKYPKCAVCSMDRLKFNHTRHLLHYADGVVQGTCSPRCASELMVQERRRKFIGIYGADFSSSAEIKPLVNVLNATYLIGSKLPGTMTRVSKVAFATRESAEQAKELQGGELATFADVVSASFDELSRAIVEKQLTLSSESAPKA